MRKSFWFAVSFVASVCLLSGCGGGGGENTYRSPPTVAPTKGLVSATGRFQDLVFTATAPKRIYAVGENVPLTLTVENQGSADHYSLVSYFNRTVDAIVYAENGEDLGTIVFPPNGAGGPVDVPLVYEAGKSRSFSLTWHQSTFLPNQREPLPRGTYRLRLFIGVDNLDGSPTPEHALGTDDLEIIIQ